MTERRSDEELRAETEAWIESLDKDAHWARSAEQREHFDRQRRILSDLLAAGVDDTQKTPRPYIMGEYAIGNGEVEIMFSDGRRVRYTPRIIHLPGSESDPDAPFPEIFK